MTVIEEWNRLKRDKNKTSKVAEKARKDFMKKGKTVFWIGRKNMREILKKRTMDKEYLKADLEFLRDQRTKRKMSLGSKDRAYCKRIEKRDERKKRSLELPGRSNNNTDILSEIEFSSDASNMNTSLDSESSVTSLIGQSTRTNTSNQSELQEQVKLPKTFVQDIALTRVPHNISSRNLMHIATNLVVSAGGNVDNFSLSEPTIGRAKKKVVSEAAVDHKAEIKECANKAKYPMIADFVGKILKDITDGKKSKKDRFALLVNIDGNLKLLGIPAMTKGTVEAQYRQLVGHLEEYEIIDKVKGLCFDTTATNTGRLSGTNVRFTQRQGSIMLELACRRHVYELHIKHFSEQLTTGKTSAPENQLLKRFYNTWNDLKDNIDSTMMVVRLDVASYLTQILHLNIQGHLNTMQVEVCQKEIFLTTIKVT